MSKNRTMQEKNNRVKKYMVEARKKAMTEEVIAEMVCQKYGKSMIINIESYQKYDIVCIIDEKTRGIICRIGTLENLHRLMLNKTIDIHNDNGILRVYGNINKIKKGV